MASRMWSNHGFDGKHRITSQLKKRWNVFVWGRGRRRCEASSDRNLGGEEALTDATLEEMTARRKDRRTHCDVYNQPVGGSVIYLPLGAKTKGGIGGEAEKKYRDLEN